MVTGGGKTDATTVFLHARRRIVLSKIHSRQCQQCINNGFCTEKEKGWMSLCSNNKPHLFLNKESRSLSGCGWLKGTGHEQISKTIHESSVIEKWVWEKPERWVLLAGNLRCERVCVSQKTWHLGCSQLEISCGVLLTIKKDALTGLSFYS